jgi:protein-tyrosine phosphatase
VPATPASVLCVCTSNVCRSPAAELLLRAGLRHRVGDRAARAIQVTSAGTWASRGRPVDPGTASALRAFGVSEAELAAARSAPLTREAVAAADLVIGAAAEHVRGVWRLQIAARYRTFTLGEMARLVGRIDPSAVLPAVQPAVPPTVPPPSLDGAPGAGLAARLRALVRAASAVREAGRAPDAPYVTDAYDLPDPTDNDVAQRDMVEQTAVHVDALLDLLAGPAPASRLARDRVHWPAWAVQWSRSRSRRGAPR